MQLTITLNSDEIKSAIADYLEAAGVDIKDKAISVKFDEDNLCIVHLTNEVKRRKRRTPAEMAIAREEANKAIAALDAEENNTSNDDKDEDEPTLPEEEVKEDAALTQVTQPEDTQSLFKQ